MEPKGLIFDIQSFSVHDGPGCRTNVFLEGLSLIHISKFKNMLTFSFIF